MNSRRIYFIFASKTNNCHLNTARYRTLDPQLGHWWQIDPEVETFEAWSAYNSNLDNPIRYEDPEGDFCIPCIPVIVGIGLWLSAEPVTAPTTYTTSDGKKVVIQDHSAGHKFNEGGKGDQGPHFNVRPSDNTRTGTVDGTKPHYNFNNPQ